MAAYQDCLTAANQCQSQIARIAEKGSLPERYCLLLEELRVEALRQTERVQPSIAHVQTSTQVDKINATSLDSGLSSEL